MLKSERCCESLRVIRNELDIAHGIVGSRKWRMIVWPIKYYVLITDGTIAPSAPLE